MQKVSLYMGCVHAQAHVRPGRGGGCWWGGKPRSSIILPTVMREGKPWGFMMRSGQIPVSPKGHVHLRPRPHRPDPSCVAGSLSTASSRTLL